MLAFTAGGIVYAATCLGLGSLVLANCNERNFVNSLLLMYAVVLIAIIAGIASGIFVAISWNRSRKD